MIKTVELAPYRQWFRTTFTITLLLIAGSILLVWMDLRPSLAPASTKLLRDLLWYGPLVLVVLYTFYIVKQQRKLLLIADFEERKVFHANLYRRRMYGYMVSTFLACVLYWLMATRFYLYISFFEILGLLVGFPRRQIFQRELGDPDIVFV